MFFDVVCVCSTFFVRCVLCLVCISRCLCIGLWLCLRMLCVPSVLWLQRIDVCDFVFMSWLHKEHRHLLPGPGFRSTSLQRSSRATSQPAGDRRLGAEKTADLGPPLGGQGEGVVICPLFGRGTPTSNRPLRLEPVRPVSFFLETNQEMSVAASDSKTFSCLYFSVIMK